jgi:ferredoxin
MATTETVFYVLLYAGLLVATVIILRMRKKLKEEGWWSGLVVEGRQVRVRTDWDRCMGASSCVELAPKVFRLDWQKKKSMFDPARLELLDEKGANAETIFLAAQSCPYKAIILEDADTGERIFPWS